MSQRFRSRRKILRFDFRWFELLDWLWNRFADLNIKLECRTRQTIVGNFIRENLKSKFKGNESFSNLRSTDKTFPRFAFLSQNSHACLLFIVRTVAHKNTFCVLRMTENDGDWSLVCWIFVCFDEHGQWVINNRQRKSKRAKENEENATHKQTNKQTVTGERRD